MSKVAPRKRETNISFLWLLGDRRDNNGFLVFTAANSRTYPQTQATRHAKMQRTHCWKPFPQISQTCPKSFPNLLKTFPKPSQNCWQPLGFVWQPLGFVPKPNGCQSLFVKIAFPQCCLPSWTPFWTPKASQERPKRLPKPPKWSPKREKIKVKKQVVFRLDFFIDFVCFLMVFWMIFKAKTYSNCKKRNSWKRYKTLAMARKSRVGLNNN